MKRHTTFLAAAFLVLASGSLSPVMAQQTFQSFTCADGARFTAAFLKYDPKQAHLQIDGKAVTLRKRFTLTGSRYTGRGISLTMTKNGTFLRHGKRGVTACSPS
jgi:membrane-bound inhibitor of C-type lysozyme